jgi:hypothetical protein
MIVPFAKKFGLLTLALIMAVSFFLPSKTVYAGSNGQQISVTTNRLTWVTVEGKNQRGQQVKWVQFNAGGNNVVTWGWWWIGRVKVTAVVGPTADWMTTNKKVCYIDVPKVQRHDVDYLICRP